MRLPRSFIEPLSITECWFTRDPALCSAPHESGFKADVSYKVLSGDSLENRVLTLNCLSVGLSAGWSRVFFFFLKSRIVLILS